MPNTTPHTPHAPKLDGQQAVELLPWLVNGSLDGAEIEALGSELAQLDGKVDSEVDGDFAAELAATGEMLWITEQHIPTLALTEYALGLEAGELGGPELGGPELGGPDLTREEIELHLEGCAACRAELELIRADESESEHAPEEATVLDFTAARRRRIAGPAKQPAPAWRRLALAAALATAVVGALLVQVRSDLEPSIGLVAEVLPADQQVADSEKILRSSTPDAALFFDGFESGDTGNWTAVSN